MVIKQLGIDVKKFTEKDVDIDIVEQEAAIETQKIFDNPKSRDGRTLEEIYKVSRQSHIAERYMIEKHNFINDSRPYMDIIFKAMTVDVKTSTKSILAVKRETLQLLADRRAEGKLVADYVLGFNITGGIYICKYFSRISVVARAKTLLTSGRRNFKVVDQQLSNNIRTTPERVYNYLIQKKNMSDWQAATAMLQTYGIKVV